MHPTHQIRRIVTGHDDSGKAIVESDGICPHVKVREGAGFVSSLLWVTDETPARVDLRQDRAARTIGVAAPANGAARRGTPSCTGPRASTTPSYCKARSTCCSTIPRCI